MRHRRQKELVLSTGVGTVRIVAWYGVDPASGQWGYPIRQVWGLSSHQQMSPGLEDKLAFTLTATSSYAEAAALAQKWGCQIDDSTLHVLAQRLGKRAQEQTQERLKTPPEPLWPQQKASELAVFMLDGWQARYRGAGWGKRKTKENRVDWHEVRLGVFYLQEQAGRTEGGRGILNEKVVISWQGEPMELGRRLHWEALRRGVGRAQKILVVGDGASWIWNVKADRWADAQEVLDFYHASEHLWQLGRALYPEHQAKEWVEARLHELRHGQEEQCLAQIAALKLPRGRNRQSVREEKTYFANQSHRMHYQEVAQRGWPIGSGAVESACSGEQNRFKRRGQFWTPKGLDNLSALRQARHLKHWDQLWLSE